MGAAALALVIVLGGLFFALRTPKQVMPEAPPLPDGPPAEVTQTIQDEWKPRFESRFPEAYAQARPQSLSQYVDVMAVLWTQIQNGQPDDPQTLQDWREAFNQDATALARSLSKDEVQQLETLKSQPGLTNGHDVVIKSLLEKARSPRP